MSRKKMPNLKPVLATGFFVQEERNVLLECAKGFEKLLDIQYRIVVGRKGNDIAFSVGFDAVDFHHLAGLHKLKDLRVSRAERETVFQKILNGEISDSDITQSRCFPAIEKRLYLFAHLENILDSNELVFRYTHKLSQFSVIQAEFLLSTPHESEDVYIFLDKKENAKNYFCRSFFPKADKDYTIGQVKYTLLRKEKTTLSTGESVVQYAR